MYGMSACMRGAQSANSVEAVAPHNPPPPLGRLLLLPYSRGIGTIKPCPVMAALQEACTNPYQMQDTMVIATHGK